MKRFLNKPFPYSKPQNLWYTAVFIGLFVSLFLFIFKPFELDRLEHTILVKTTAIYGLISFLIIIITNKIPVHFFPKLFNEDSWTVWKEFTQLIFITLMIAIGNYLYTVYAGFMPFNGSAFTRMLIWTLSIASIIVGGTLVIRSNLALRRHLRDAQIMNQHILDQVGKMELPKHQEKMVLLESEIEKQNLSIPSSNIVYLTSVGNYIDCFYLDSNDVLSSGRIRNRMKTMEQKLEKYPEFFRCHRAFIVNKSLIRSVDGNAKGYSLWLKHIDKPIPVARSKSQALQAILS